MDSGLRGLERGGMGWAGTHAKSDGQHACWELRLSDQPPATSHYQRAPICRSPYLVHRLDVGSVLLDQRLRHRHVTVMTGIMKRRVAILSASAAHAWIGGVWRSRSVRVCGCGAVRWGGVALGGRRARRVRLREGVGGAASCRTTIHFAHPTICPLALALIRTAPHPNHHTTSHHHPAPPIRRSPYLVHRLDVGSVLLDQRLRHRHVTVHTGIMKRRLSPLSASAAHAWAGGAGRGAFVVW